MCYLFGTLFIVPGVAQIGFRSRTARANAASNSVMFQRAHEWPGMDSLQHHDRRDRRAVFVILGIVMFSGVLGAIH